MNNLIDKLKIYGPRRFIIFVLIDIKRKLWMQYVKGSYSQLGEDLIIDKLLNYKKNGFYVDIGAYDPDRFSNTKRFYLRGWNGLNIEPNINNYKKFLQLRKRDINLNIGIANENNTLAFYEFTPDTLSTFSETEANKYISEGFKFIKKDTVPVKKLSWLFAKYVKDKKIDFISIDTEGFEMEVLNSNDWNRWQPKLICIESNNIAIEQNKISKFLHKHGYKKMISTKINTVYSKI